VTTTIFILQVVSVFTSSFHLSLGIWFGIWAVPSAVSILWVVDVYFRRKKLHEAARKYCKQHPKECPSIKFLKMYSWLSLVYRNAAWFIFARWWFFLLFAFTTQFETLNTDQILTVNCCVYFSEAYYLAETIGFYYRPSCVRTSKKGNYIFVTR